MPAYFCLTVRFLQPYSHGRGDGGDPEWPPSPLRVFQALVAAAAATWNERLRVEYAAPALRWLERQPPPEIVAAVGTMSDNPYLLYIPNNTADLLVPGWKRGSLDDGVKREQKVVRPRHLTGEAVHYLFPGVDAEFERHHGALQTAARGITHVGWGVDVVVADARLIDEAEAAGLPGERWRVAGGVAGDGLRVPVAGTLAALHDRHRAFLCRLDGDRFNPVPPLTEYQVVEYRRATDPPALPVAAFEIVKPLAELAELASGGSKYRPFDTPRWATAVAGMVRHATDLAARDAGWPIDRINTYVHGHTPDGTDRATGEAAGRRFAYLPLPTINPLKVEMIRRVLVVGPPGGRAEIEWARKMLSGRELFAQDRAEPVAMLSVISTNEKTVLPYLDRAAAWSTVTPVILPGHDDGRAGKAEGLLRKALRQAGLPPELADDPRTELEWRAVGFRPGVGHVREYRVPDALDRRARVHVRVRFPVAVRGPLAVGAGRYRGLGVFAAE